MRLIIRRKAEASAAALQTDGPVFTGDILSKRFRVLLQYCHWQFDDQSFDYALIRERGTRLTYVVFRLPDGLTAVQRVAAQCSPCAEGYDLDHEAGHAARHAAAYASQIIRRYSAELTGSPIYFRYALDCATWPPLAAITEAAPPIPIIPVLGLVPPAVFL